MEIQINLKDGKEYKITFGNYVISDKGRIFKYRNFGDYKHWKFLFLNLHKTEVKKTIKIKKRSLL